MLQYYIFFLKDSILFDYFTISFSRWKVEVALSDRRGFDAGSRR